MWYETINQSYYYYMISTYFFSGEPYFTFVSSDICKHTQRRRNKELLGHSAFGETKDEGFLGLSNGVWCAEGFACSLSGVLICQQDWKCLKTFLYLHRWLVSYVSNFQVVSSYIQLIVKVALRAAFKGSHDWWSALFYILLIQSLQFTL